MMSAGFETRGMPEARWGGKGQQLHLLQQLGLPVPDFWVIPAEWSEQHVHGMPAALREQIAVELQVRGWLDCPLAVRSSAEGEDAAQASFAGVFCSELNIRGVAAVCAAVEAVWASLDTPAAQAYRQRFALPQSQRMAVVVMPLLPALASGVAFTCDPRTGREDRLVVHANWGLGEALVAGEVDADEYVFAEDREDCWRLETQHIGSKRVQRQPLPAGGTAAVAVSSVQATQPVLTSAQAEELAALVWDAAQALDVANPCYDLEWVWDGQRFWLVQARPVTRRPLYTYPALQGQPAVWTRGNTGEVMPEPLSPMDWCFSRRGVSDLLTQGWQLAGVALLPGAQRACLLHGRLYLNASLMQWECWDGIGLTPARMNALMGGHQPEIAVAAPTWRERMQRGVNTLRYLFKAPAMRRRGEQEIAQAHALAEASWMAPLPVGLSAVQEALMPLMRPAREFHGMHFLQGSGGGSLSFLLEQLECYFPGESEGLASALLASGEPSVTAQQGHALLDLAQLAQECGAQGGDFVHHPRFSAAFTAFLHTYGHRGHYETYLRNPRWRDEPEKLLALLPSLATCDLVQLRQRQQIASEQAWQRVNRVVPWWRRPVLRRLVQAANQECNQREAARSAIIALLAAARRLWLALGESLVQVQLLGAADEIFLLTPAELLRFQQGQLAGQGLQARAQQRRMVFDHWCAQDAPEWWTQATPGVVHLGAEEVESTSQATQIWRGVATGTGVARGRVRRLQHPAEGAALLPGEILLAPSTDPGWTPLFLKAAGLVVERGGYLSHGAIVAREFALPAVVNLPGILAQLQDGDEIEVDGQRGEVRRIG